MSPHHLDQALFSEFLPCIVERFGYAVCVQSKRVPEAKSGLPNRTIPFIEESQYGPRGIESLNRVVGPEEKGGKVPTIRIAQALQFVVIFGEEKRGVGIFGRILEKELVH